MPTLQAPPLLISSHSQSSSPSLLFSFPNLLGLLIVAKGLLKKKRLNKTTPFYETPFAISLTKVTVQVLVISSSTAKKATELTKLFQYFAGFEKRGGLDSLKGKHFFVLCSACTGTYLVISS